ncbi:UNVERIFIED_CONTAM: hypothetical protein PYX00_010882 [Menopon gallinae]|uniref:RRM domain-containing protein n=1 Tax=Menopon gallinae TaxID=328185 RepID=A0AAW2H6G9_9NEOP
MILNSANKRQYLIDVLDRLLRETNFYEDVVKKSENILEHSKGSHEDLCAMLGEYVYDNMPDEARRVFEKEVCKLIDRDVHPSEASVFRASAFPAAGTWRIRPHTATMHDFCVFPTPHGVRLRSMNNRPCRTLYFRNLNERVSRGELKRRLRMLLSRYANVVDVVAWDAARLRGQAFATFRTMKDATKIKSLLDNFFFLGSPMKVHFAKDVTERHRAREETVFHPTKTLVVKRLSENISKPMLDAVFGEEEGFVRIRHVPVKRIALIDFIDVNMCEHCFIKYSEDGVSIDGEAYKLEPL